MIVIVARWDSSQLDPKAELRFWRQIKGAFAASPADMKLIFVPVLLSGVTATQCETMEEALDVARRFAPKAKRVFLEPKGTKTLKQLPKRDMILVLGNTETGNAEHAKPSEMYGIKSVGETDLYGVNAAAIALAVRHEYG